MRRHPGVRASVVEMIPSEQSKALLNGTIDVGFTRPLEAPFDQLLRSELMYLDPLMAALPKDHPLARGPVDLGKLANERFVLVARETSDSLHVKIMSLCSEAKFSPRVVATGTVWSSVVLLVQAGDGIAILPSNLQQRGSFRDLAFCPLTNHGASIGLMIAWSPQRENTAKQAFLDLVREYPKVRWVLMLTKAGVGKNIINVRPPAVPSAESSLKSLLRRRSPPRILPV
jgi:DNA-binding transcriptional LysR family regulator